MLINEQFVDLTRGELYGETGLYEPFTENVGDLYRSLVKEYGRCVGKIYVDKKGEERSTAIGWVFLKRTKYSDSDQAYLQETRVTLHDGQPQHRVEHHYHTL